jgi:hypothetical protein
MNDLQKFYAELLDEVDTLQMADEDGNSHEQVFTMLATSLLADAGETENSQIKYDERITGRGLAHKINGYSLSENYETLDLYITIYNNTSEILNITKTEAESVIGKALAFFRTARYKDYVNAIDPSSEIYDLAHTLATSVQVSEILARVNVFLLTNGLVKAEVKQSDTAAGYKIFYHVRDLNYLYNLTEKTHNPIEISFEDAPLQCITVAQHNDDYQSYLAIIPGETLALIYEQYGARLLEQNVRSFLQFTGKINGGIRKTIKHEPHMFLAFNNGIAATADEVKILDTAAGKAIAWVKDLQIVNGGQTTASIFHTRQKDKADVSGIFVPVKLTLVRKKDKFTEIVARISEYANTQNKVSVVDLGSNKPFHIDLEKVSRTVWAPPALGKTSQTRWFYERARGQYKNARLKEGLTISRRNAFDLKNPKTQVLTKEDVAKYNNTWAPAVESKKNGKGPHVVARGNQKNYIQFIQHNTVKKPDNVYFEDTVAKAILYRTAEKLYGVKANAIGDMRYVTVPYSLAWLAFRTNYKLDLFRIWKQQSLSEPLKELLYQIMQHVDAYIHKNAPGSLVGEWAKKEDCWLAIQGETFRLSLDPIKGDLEKAGAQRRRQTEQELAYAEIDLNRERIESIPYTVWKRIEQWGYTSNNLTQFQYNAAGSIGDKLSTKKKLTESDIANGIKVLDVSIPLVPELFHQIDDSQDTTPALEFAVTIDQIKKVVSWDKRAKRLSDFEYRLMDSLANGSKSLSDHSQKLAKKNIEKAKKYGFRD